MSTVLPYSRLNDFVLERSNACSVCSRVDVLTESMLRGCLLFGKDTRNILRANIMQYIKLLQLMWYITTVI
jgi:hypothetical protein